MMNTEKEFDITFVHTGEVHVATFESLIKSMNSTFKVNHIVNSGLLEKAMNHYPMNDLQDEIHTIMQLAAKHSRRVVCTCSTIGAMAETTPGVVEGQVIRIDRAMAMKAIEIGGKILVVAALKSTLTPTLDLLNDISKTSDNQVTFDVLCVEEAWGYFKAGNNETYIQSIADAIQSYNEKFDVIVLAQASMAEVSERMNGTLVPILSSPYLGVESIVRTLKS